MNQYDFKLILLILVISILLLIFTNLKSNNYAYVYYDNKLVLEIDLTKNDTYKVEGYNGDVLIEVKENKLRVYKENSPLHICSSEGFKNSGSIVCLPNKIVINFEDKEDNFDAVIG